LFKLIFMSHWYDCFRDACRILEGNDVFWNLLLMYVLYVMNDYLHTIVVISSICISSWFPYVCVCVLLLYRCFLPTIECCSCFTVPCGWPKIPHCDTHQDAHNKKDIMIHNLRTSLSEKLNFKYCIYKNLPSSLHVLS
jgi:hypothetical protein